MKRNILKLVWLLSPALLLASCNLAGSIDKIEPSHVVEDKNVIVDASTAEAALRGVYKSLCNFNVGSLRPVLSVWAGTLGTSSVSGANAFMPDTEGRSSIKIDNAAVKNAYIGYYNVVNEASSFIQNLSNSKTSDLTDTRKTEMLGEAYCLRAMANFILLQSFGEFYNTKSSYGIVLYDNPPRNNTPQPRSTVAEVYNAIEKDLVLATQDAPSAPMDHYHVSALFAKALLAKVYLSESKYQDAETMATKVITEAESCGYGLEYDYLSVFTSQFYSPEMLFAPYTDVSEPLSSSWNASKPGKLLQQLAVSLGENNSKDPRYEATWENVSNQNKTAKYPNFKGTADINSYYFMRLPEVYYIKAEAETRLGNTTAARVTLLPLLTRDGFSDTYVNGIPDTSILSTIIKHKIMELSVENGVEWFDLVRFHFAGDLSDWSDNEKAALPAFNQTVLPIPQEAIAGNNLLVQNPQY